MQIDKVTCKAIIESMDSEELDHYIAWLDVIEIPRHQMDIRVKARDNKRIREILRKQGQIQGLIVHLKLNQTAIYRHRQDIKSTRECILKAEDRMDLLGGEQ